VIVLSRKCSERIFIGSDIILTLVHIQGDKVKLGIDAPREVVVDRLEVRERIAREGGRDRRRHY